MQPDILQNRTVGNTAATGVPMERRKRLRKNTYQYKIKPVPTIAIVRTKNFLLCYPTRKKKTSYYAIVSHKSSNIKLKKNSRSLYRLAACCLCSIEGR